MNEEKEVPVPQPVAVAGQEPIGYAPTYLTERIAAGDAAVMLTVTRKPLPGHGVTVALYTAPVPAAGVQGNAVLECLPCNSHGATHYPDGEWEGKCASCKGTGVQPDSGRDAALVEMEARKDAAYLERNQVVAALAKCFPSGVARTAIEGWSEDWHGCVYIDLPTGQASWHFHDSQAYLFDGLRPYVSTWDGHDTPEKYRRLSALAAHPAPSNKIEALNPIAWVWWRNLANGGYTYILCKTREEADKLAEDGAGLPQADLVLPLVISHPAPSSDAARFDFEDVKGRRWRFGLRAEDSKCDVDPYGRNIVAEAMIDKGDSVSIDTYTRLRYFKSATSIMLRPIFAAHPANGAQAGCDFPLCKSEVEQDKITADVHAQLYGAQAGLSDGDRFRWLTKDPDDAELREMKNGILHRMPVMSYSAACMSIDANILAAAKKGG